MGRNYHSVCHKCKEALMHFRGKEGDFMQLFAREHFGHEKETEIYNDYIKEVPENYKDMGDTYECRRKTKTNNADVK